MKISFVVPSISSTVLGVVTNHARILSRDHTVQIVGPDLGSGVCPLYKGVWPYTIVQTPYLYRVPEFFSSMRRISDAIEGDVVIAVKSFAQTVLPALRQQRIHGKKIMVYLDEWDGALYRRLSFNEKCRMWMKNVHHPTGEQYVPFMERRLGRFDRILCSTKWLADRFHGEMMHFGVDTVRFDPSRVNAVCDETWAGLGLKGKKVLVFGGVVRPHKGLEEVLDAMAEVERDDIRLLIVGPHNEHVQDLIEHSLFGRLIVCSDSIHKDEMPRWLKRADVVVVPLKDDLLGRTQMPCKVFEAMAMEKIVVATAVSDLVKVLDGCGYIYRTRTEFKAILEDILNMDHNSAVEIGRGSRRKCQAEYSRSRVEEKYQEVICAVGNGCAVYDNDHHR